MARPGFTVSDEAIFEMGKMMRSAELATKELLLSIKNLTPVQKKQLLAEMQSIVAQLDLGTEIFLKEWVPYHYVKGSDEVIQKMVKAKMRVPEKELDQADLDSMQAISDRAYSNLTESYRVLQRSFSRIISDSLRIEVNQRIATGVTAGEGRKVVLESIKQALSENELFVLKDRGGKRWTMEAYGEMLTRTEMANSSREGRSNRAIKNGVDLVQIDGYGTICEICKPWEFKIVSLTGQTPGYPTLQQAMNTGFMHPNCKHNYNPYRQEFAEL